MNVYIKNITIQPLTIQRHEVDAKNEKQNIEDTKRKKIERIKGRK